MVLRDDEYRPAPSCVERILNENDVALRHHPRPLQELPRIEIVVQHVVLELPRLHGNALPAVPGHGQQTLRVLDGTTRFQRPSEHGFLTLL